MQTEGERESTRGDVSHTLRDFFCKQNDLPAGGEAEHLTCIFFFLHSCCYLWRAERASDYQQTRESEQESNRVRHDTPHSPSVMEMMLLLWLQTVLLDYWMASQYLFVLVCTSAPLQPMTGVSVSVTNTALVSRASLHCFFTSVLLISPEHVVC